MPRAWRRCVALAVAAALLLTATGCWDRRELDDQHFILALGIDEGEEEGYIVSALFAVPAVITARTSGGESGGSGAGGAGAGLVMTVADRSVLGALNAMEATSDRRLNISHIKGVYIGESLARKGVTGVFNALTRWQETRGVAYVAVARGGAQALLRHLEPRIERNPGKYIEEMFIAFAHTGLIPHCHLHDVANDIEIPTRQPLIALAAINPVALAGGELGAAAPPPADATFLAGAHPRVGGLPEDYAGAAVMRGDAMVGVLDAAQTRVALMMRGEFKHGQIGFPDPDLPGKDIVLSTERARETEVRVRWRGRQPELTIVMALDAEISEAESPHDWTAPGQAEALGRLAGEFLREQAEEVIAIAQEAGTDVLRAGEALRGAFATRQELEAFDWGSRFPEADIRAEVTVTVRRPGLMTAPVQPKPPGNAAGRGD